MGKDRTLLETTKELLLRDKRNLMQISKISGLGYFWLRQFKYGQIGNPGINNVQRLHDALLKP